MSTIAAAAQTADRIDYWIRRQGRVLINRARSAYRPIAAPERAFRHRRFGHTAEITKTLWPCNMPVACASDRYA
jgi:hypothetical protein